MNFDFFWLRKFQKKCSTHTIVSESNFDFYCYFTVHQACLCKLFFARIDTFFSSILIDKRKFDIRIKNKRKNKNNKDVKKDLASFKCNGNLCIE